MAQGVLASAPAGPVLTPAPAPTGISPTFLPEIVLQFKRMAIPRKYPETTEALLQQLEELVDDILEECETIPGFAVQRSGVAALIHIIELAREHQAEGTNPEKCMGVAVKLALRGINSLLDRETIHPVIRDRFKMDPIMEVLKSLNRMKAWHVPGMDRTMAQFW